VTDHWHVTERGALLYGDESGGITVAGLDAWKDSTERTEAIRALARWCSEAIESAAELAPATTVLWEGETTGYSFKHGNMSWVPMGTDLPVPPGTHVVVSAQNQHEHHDQQDDQQQTHG
jgi:hypothetical protein